MTAEVAAVADPIDEIKFLRAELDEARRGWQVACEDNRRLDKEIEWLRGRIADMRNTIADLELRVSR